METRTITKFATVMKIYSTLKVHSPTPGMPVVDVLPLSSKYDLLSLLLCNNGGSLCEYFFFANWQSTKCCYSRVLEEHWRRNGVLFCVLVRLTCQVPSEYSFSGPYLVLSWTAVIDPVLKAQHDPQQPAASPEPPLKASEWSAAGKAQAHE